MITIKDSSGKVIKEIEADISKTLLEQLNEAGVELPAACYAGVCGACMCEIEAGADKIDKNFAGQEGFPTDETEVMTCIAGITDPNAEIILKSVY